MTTPKRATIQVNCKQTAAKNFSRKKFRQIDGFLKQVHEKKALKTKSLSLKNYQFLRV